MSPSTNAEPLSDLEIQLELSDIHRQVKRLRQQISNERSEPEDGPLSAYLQFALKSLESAAATLDPEAEVYSHLNYGWAIQKPFTTPDKGKGVHER